MHIFGWYDFDKATNRQADSYFRRRRTMETIVFLVAVCVKRLI